MERILHALADRNRLRIVMILDRGPMTVSEISSVLGLSQSNASRHLKALHDAGVLERRGVSGWVLYSLAASDPFVSSLMSVLREELARLEGHGADLAALTRCYERRSDESRAFFASRASDWETIAAGLPDMSGYSGMLEDLLGTGDTLVELGCGTGGLLARLHGFFRTVIGVDSSPEMLDMARRSSALPGVELRLGMLEHLPVADGEADAALAHMVLHHMADPASAFPEAARILKSGGMLVVADLLPHSNDGFRVSQGDLWPGLDPDEVGRWAGGAGFAPSACRSDDGGRVFVAGFVKGDAVHGR